MKSIGVVGGGAWGTALAVVVNRAGTGEMTLWTRNRHVYESIIDHNRNDIYLPDVYIDPSIEITRELPEVCQQDLLLMVVPAQHMRATCIAMSDYLPAETPLVICSKGVERGSLSLMSEVVQSVLPKNPVAVLSGPNFAYEAAKGKPTATTIACQDAELGEQIAFMIGSSMFRPYVQPDVIGTQIGGAVKNVIAIACGIAMGRELGENARAALITRSVSELRRLCLVKGGQGETLMGLSGLGDLILTCNSAKSRNTSLGIALGQGKTLDEVLSERKGVTEGVASAESIQQLAQMHAVDMPICRAVYEVLYEDVDIDAVITQLLDRPFTREML